MQDKWLDLPARWTWPQNLHITVVFLGSANDQEVIDICKSAAEAARRHDPFELTLSRITYGPLPSAIASREGGRTKEPRMVWAVGEESRELGALQADLTNTFYETGNESTFAFGDNVPSRAKATEDKSMDEDVVADTVEENSEPRVFAPHVTLARIKQFELHKMEREEVPRIDEPINHTFLVESIDVMESELKKGGPKYTILESLKLGE